MRRSISEVHRVLSELERLRKRRRVCGGGRIRARMSAAEEAVLRAEEVDYSEGGDDFRHWDYFWTNVFNQNRVVAQCQPQRVPRS